MRCPCFWICKELFLFHSHPENHFPGFPTAFPAVFPQFFRPLLPGCLPSCLLSLLLPLLLHVSGCWLGLPGNGAGSPTAAEMKCQSVPPPGAPTKGVAPLDLQPAGWNFPAHKIQSSQSTQKTASSEVIPAVFLTKTGEKLS